MDGGGARICMSVPLYHCFGCVVGSILAPLHGNMMVFPSPVFDAEASLKATQDERWVRGAASSRRELSWSRMSTVEAGE